MILAAGAVTIYFVGLVHFYAGGREVIVPRAAGAVTRAGVAMAPHQADVVISGLDEAGCRGFGRWEAPLCKVNGIAGQRIVLPPASPATFEVQASFNAIPSLAALCSSIGALHSDVVADPPDPTKVAARVTLTSGKLYACTDREEWVSYVVTDPGALSVGSKSVTLPAGATVWIVNRPTSAASASMAHAAPESHFGWYYTLYNGADSCTGIPDVSTKSFRCPTGYASFESGTSGTVGCSNSTCCTH